MLDRKEIARRQIVRLVFVIYFLLIFEGALRKWAFPQLKDILFFMREPFVILTYWIVYKNRMWPKKTPVFSLGTKLLVLFGGLTVIQMFLTPLPPVVLIYGWRNYFFYLPLIFIIGENFRGEDLKRLVRYSLLLAIPISLLIYNQVHAPVRSFINQSVVEEVFYTETGLRGGTMIRATGTFTFFHGHQLFIGSIIAFLFATWILPRRERPLSGLLLYAASVAGGIIFIYDFTRAPIFFAGFIIMGSVYSGYLIRRREISLRAKMLTVSMVVLAIFIFANFFGKTYSMKIERIKLADTKRRSVKVLKSFTDVLNVPSFGYGIGGSSRASKVLIQRAGGKPYPGVAGEDEWRRTVAEVGPLFGLIYIGYRIMLVFWLFRGAVNATRRSGNPLPLLLISYIGTIILVWYITHIGTVHGYGFLFAGFCAAANNLGKEAPEEKTTVWS